MLLPPSESHSPTSIAPIQKTYWRAERKIALSRQQQTGHAEIQRPVFRVEQARPEELCPFRYREAGGFIGVVVRFGAVGEAGKLHRRE